MKNFFRCLLAVLFLFSTCEYSRAAKIGETVFRENFGNEGALKKWRGKTPQTQIVDGENDERAWQRQTKEGASQLLAIEIPTRELRGAAWRVASRMKAENVSATPQP